MKFRKRQEIIEAEQFFYDKKPWPEGVEEDQSGTVLGCDKNVMQIKISERFIAFINESDWIITDSDGERRPPCRSDIFNALYEKVE